MASGPQSEYGCEFQSSLGRVSIPRDAVDVCSRDKSHRCVTRFNLGVEDRKDLVMAFLSNREALQGKSRLTWDSPNAIVSDSVLNQSPVSPSCSGPSGLFEWSMTLGAGTTTARTAPGSSGVGKRRRGTGIAGARSASPDLTPLQAGPLPEPSYPGKG